MDEERNTPAESKAEDRGELTSQPGTFGMGSGQGGAVAARRAVPWSPPWAVVRLLAITAVFAGGVTAALIADAWMFARESAQVHTALRPAAELVLAARSEVRDYAPAGSQLPDELISLHNRLTSSLAHVENLLRDTEPGITIGISTGVFREFEGRWWGYQTTGIEPPPLPTSLPCSLPFLKPVPSQERCDYQTMTQQDVFRPASARKDVIDAAEGLKQDVIDGSANEAASYAARRRRSTRSGVVTLTLVLLAVALRRWRIAANARLPVVRIARRFGRGPSMRFRLLRRPLWWGGAALAAVLFSAAPLQAFIAFMNVHSAWKRVGLAAVIAVVGFSVGYGMWVRCRRRLPPDVRNFLALDGRPPVLYLRAFRQDKTAQRFRGLHTREEHLVRGLSRVGPAVAVGRPEESTTPLGATRLYISDDDWQPVVTSLLGLASLVVLAVGRSPGIQWELKTAVRVVAPERLLLLITPDTDIKMLRQALPAGIPDELLPAVPEGGRSVSSVMRFGPDWEPGVNDSLSDQKTPERWLWSLISPDLRGAGTLPARLRRLLTYEPLAFVALSVVGTAVINRLALILVKFLSSGV